MAVKDYTFDKFMDDIITREKKTGDERRRRREEEDADSWGRKRDLKNREIPGNRITWKG